MTLIIGERDHLILYPIAQPSTPNQVVPPGTYEVKTEKISGVEWWTIILPTGKCGKVTDSPEMKKFIRE